MEEIIRDDILEIKTPNTVSDSDAAWYSTKQGYTFKRLATTGENAYIHWIVVYKNGTKFMQVRESVCTIYFKSATEH